MLVIDNFSTRLKTLEQSPGIVLKNWNHETTQLFFATCFTRPTLKTEIIQQPLIISTVGLQIENEWDGPIEHIQFNGFEKGKRNESFCNWDVNSNLCIQLVYQFIIFFSYYYLFISSCLDSPDELLLFSFWIDSVPGWVLAVEMFHSKPPVRFLCPFLRFILMVGWKLRPSSWSLLNYEPKKKK